MTPDSSVTNWIFPAKLGDDDAARMLWQRYHKSLLSLMEERLKRELAE